MVMNEDATKYVGDVLLTEFGKEFATTECVGENVVKDDVMINTSAVSQTGTSVESEDTTTESVGENVDDVFSQEDEVHHHKLPSMKENVNDTLSLENDEAESASEAESLETESERKKAPLVDQPNVVFPATFMSFDTNIQFGSFNCLNETKSVLLNPEIEPKCITNPKNPEPVLTDLRKSDNGVISEGVDDDGRSCKDAILEEITVKWASMKVLKESLNSMNLELMAAKQLLKSKRQQIHHIKGVINKVKNAIAVEDIDKRINKADHTLKDKTLSTEDENKFILEIKQLKIMRARLASNIVSPDEIQQKDQVEELLKDLNMELETLEDDVIKSQVARNALSNKYDEERDMEKELWARFVAEEDFCKEDSSAHLYSLEKYLNEEVERYMDEWDIDEEFGRYNMFAINSGPTLDEVKFISEVTDLETLKTVKSVQGAHLGDQINENVFEKVEPIMKTETYELTKEEIETLKEKIQMDEGMKRITAQERHNINALKTKKQAEMGAQQKAQGEAQQQEKMRLRRLRKREKKRASLERKRALAAEDAANNNVNDGIVGESNKSKEFEKQPKPTIIYKNWWTHRGNMIITFVVLILWVFVSLSGPHLKTYIF